MNTVTNIILSIAVIIEGITLALTFDCSRIYKEDSGGTRSYLANITFKAPKKLVGRWHAELRTDKKFAFIGGKYVYIEENDSKQYAKIVSRNTTLRISKGERVSFRIRISYLQYDPKPSISSLRWENVQICHCPRIA